MNRDAWYAQRRVEAEAKAKADAEAEAEGLGDYAHTKSWQRRE